ncbi:MAG: hypothetical protein K0R79_4165 [Stenotrophomonas indicatrix]|uniref:OmpA family protein n=1 Tax=Stenotrophomonas indicatrix TaxID=2045451 RepID=UPI00242D5E9C|nr:OmpA family protein [Stenotrophomonas indicatrix]MDF2483808.1 hypothetical protein [Stenotrophomonas indicatrix]
MNKKILTAALLGGLAFAQAASAQEFDDRWYLTGSAGFNFQDNDRLTNDAPFVTLGLGKFISPNWSLDGELNYQNPNFDANQDQNWSQYGVSFDLRRHFIKEGRGWNPYIVGGLGYQKSEEEYPALDTNGPRERKDGNLAAKLGVGLQTTFDKRVAVRAEVAYRADFDDQSIAARDESWFGDVLASVGVVIPLGPAPVAAAPAPAPVAPSCADLDDDGDGVNNCDDKCPNSQPGQTIGPDGCPVPGHTDSKGTDAYNQKLSERRATAVYNYLTKNGVDAGRLAGPIGYGESRPIAPNTNPDGSDNPEGRAKNRRTELNVQN